MRSKSILLVVLALSFASGCSGLTTMPPVLVGRAPDAPSEALVRRLVEAARTQGYSAEPVQVENGRFAVRARYAEPAGGYAFTVECFRDGLVVVTPVGPRVQRRRAFYVLPRGLREELLELARVLEGAARHQG